MAKRTLNLSPAERQRRSEVAKRLHSENRFGGSQPARKSAEIRARRSSEIAQQVVERHRARIEAAILAGLNSSNVNTRLKAAELALRAGMSGERMESAEQRAEAAYLDREQLLASVGKWLMGSPSGAMIARHLAEHHNCGEFVNGTAEEDSEPVRPRARRLRPGPAAAQD
jgi:hypothetical protein